MKIQLAILGLLAVPSLAMAITTPDGTLGVNNIKGYGTYESYNYKADGRDYDYAGAGIAINQNLYNNEDYGCDVGFDYMYLESQASNIYDSYQGRYYTLNATVYKKGAFSPFFSVSTEYDTETGYGYSHYDSTYVGGAVGVECHLLPGWYVTPKISLARDLQSSDDDDGSGNYTTATLATGYWFSSHFGFFTDINYSNSSGNHGTWINAGLAVHY